MASVVQICNMALSHLGSAALVTSISPPDGSAEADWCATFYDQARTEILEPGNWAFSLKRATLVATTNTSTTWAYAYTKPADCLSARRILTLGTGISVFTADEQHAIHADDRSSAQFDIEGDVIYTNEPDAVLVYVRDVTDTTKFTPAFTAAFSFLLAAYLAGPMVRGNEGARLADAMRQRALNAAEMSSSTNANASSVETSTYSTITAVRA